jgi:hypothetical protein
MVLLLFEIAVKTSAQTEKYDTRTVIVNSEDSTVKCSIWNISIKAKTSPDFDYYWYYGGLINHNVGGYSGKLLHGKYEVFDLKQRLRSKGFFEYGVMTGTWNRWFSNGNLQFTGVFKNGKLRGKVKTYTIDGKLSSILNYNKGLLDGKAFFYVNDTVLKRYYKDGKEVVKLPKKKKDKTKVKPSKIKEQEKPDGPSQLKGQFNSDTKPHQRWWKFSFLKKDTASKNEKK